MADRDNLTAQVGTEQDAQPPAYTDDPSATASEADAPPPSYIASSSNELPEQTLSCPPIPLIVQVHAQWKQLKSLIVCGTTESDHLYTFSLHTGFSGKEPLGNGPGMILHKGASDKGPVIAAAGDESKSSARVLAFTMDSVIFMPRLLPSDRPSELVREHMYPGTEDGEVVFGFSIEVGEEKAQREKFEWRKVKKDTGDGVQAGDFQLMRISRLKDTDSTQLETEKEVLACVCWPKLFTTMTRVFTLHYIGAKMCDELGERWKLMVLMTAARLWHLKANGRTSRGVIAAGEKLHGKAPAT